MRQTLATRLLRGIGLLLVALLAATWLAGLYAAKAFANEFTQALNRSIGMYVAAERPLRPDGAPDRGRLADLAAQAMVLNPAAELYLLDDAGRVLWPANPALARNVAVSLDPVQRFIAEPVRAQAILGTDPLRPGTQAIFSAAALQHAGRTAGYVYVVIGGAAYRNLIATVAQSHILKALTVSCAVLLLLASIAAWGLHRSIARPLAQLHTDALAHARRQGIPGVAHEDDVGGAPAGATDIRAVARVIDGMVERIQQQIRALEHTDRLRRELFAHISHDLRTPLTAIRGYVETLLNDGGQLSLERRQAFIVTIARHCDRLQRLVDQVFLLARLDMPAPPIRREPVSLAELVQDVAGKWQLAAEAAELRLRVHVDPRVRSVSADIGLIEAAVENLIDNAFRHCRRTGAVEINVTMAADGVAFSVRNDGVSIDAATTVALLEPLATTRVGRAGLGLAIVRRVLALHGGEFELRSAQPEGTLARFVLP